MQTPAIGWQVYVWAYAVITVVSCLSRIAIHFKRPDLVSRGSLAESVLSLVPMAGMFGWLYRVPLLSPIFWQVVFAALCLYAVAHYFMPTMRKVYSKGLLPSLGVIAAELVTSLPGLYLLYLYGFHFPVMWAHAQP